MTTKPFRWTAHHQNLRTIILGDGIAKTKVWCQGMLERIAKLEDWRPSETAISIYQYRKDIDNVAAHMDSPKP